MSDRDQQEGTSLFGVLDIETAPPRSIATPPVLGSERRTSATHEITAIALLVARRTAPGDWEVDRLHSWDASRHDEFTMLLRFSREAIRLATAGGTVVTFNGRRHDLPVILRRAAFHRMFELPAWRQLARLSHRDLMTDGLCGREAPWLSLRDTCDSLLIPWDADFAKAAAATPDARRRKCETDVCSTFALLLYTLAMENSNGRELVGGWLALASHAKRLHARSPHVLQFAIAAEDQSIYQT
jgi:hypothetical protein